MINTTTDLDRIRIAARTAPDPWRADIRELLAAVAYWHGHYEAQCLSPETIETVVQSLIVIARTAERHEDPTIARAARRALTAIQDRQSPTK